MSVKNEHAAGNVDLGDLAVAVGVAGCLADNGHDFSHDGNGGIGAAVVFDGLAEYW